MVEDEAIIAKDIQRRLGKNGYEVTSIVSTGSGAVKKVEQDQPDLVLMDIVLPGEFDGIDAARLIRSKYDIPIIYVTAYADQDVLGDYRPDSGSRWTSIAWRRGCGRARSGSRQPSEASATVS